MSVRIGPRLSKLQQREMRNFNSSCITPVPMDTEKKQTLRPPCVVSQSDMLRQIFLQVKEEREASRENQFSIRVYAPYISSFIGYSCSSSTRHRLIGKVSSVCVKQIGPILTYTIIINFPESRRAYYTPLSSWEFIAMSTIG